MSRYAGNVRFYATWFLVGVIGAWAFSVGKDLAITGGSMWLDRAFYRFVW